jgi:hypothetical protein
MYDVFLMLELDTVPDLEWCKQRVSGERTRSENDADLACRKVEEVDGVVREGRRGIRCCDQAKLNDERDDVLDVFALILEQDDRLPRSPTAARASAKALVAIALDRCPSIFEVLVVLRWVEHQRRVDIHGGGIRQA